MFCGSHQSVVGGTPPRNAQHSSLFVSHWLSICFLYCWLQSSHKHFGIMTCYGHCIVKHIEQRASVDSIGVQNILKYI